MSKGLNLYSRRKSVPWASTWRATKIKGKGLLAGRCLLNPRHASHTLHHVYYKRWFWLPWPDWWLPGMRPIAGLERVGKDVYPVCEHCHRLLHQRNLYWQFKDEEDDESKLHNYNYFWCRVRLRCRFLLWHTFCRLLPNIYMGGVKTHWVFILLTLMSLFCVGVFHATNQFIEVLEWESWARNLFRDANL